MAILQSFGGYQIGEEVTRFPKPDLSGFGDPPHQASRHNSGKPEIHQVPIQLTRGVAEGFTYGAKKYEKHNWRLGREWSTPYDSAMRHMLAWWDGADNDPESGLNHLKHAATNLAILLHHLEKHPDQDDRPDREVTSA